MIEPRTYVNKPFDVEAIQVTEENMLEVAEWCKGSTILGGKDPYIKVAVRLPRNERQTQAHVGDWVLITGRGPKVYTDVAFHKSYDPKVDEVPMQSLTPEETDKILEQSVAAIGLGVYKMSGVVPQDQWIVHPDAEGKGLKSSPAGDDRFA